MKRKVKKKTEKLLNKQTSTNDKTQENKTSIKLFQKKKSNNIANNNSIQSNNTTANNFLSNLENKIKRTVSEENLLNSIKETENLKNILSGKMEELENNKKNCMKELLIINNNIKEKLVELEISSNKSKIILNKLNQLNSKINEEYQKAKVKDAINKIQNEKINKIKNNNKIKNGNKQILLNKIIIDKFKTHKEKLEKIVVADKTTKIKNLNEELDNLKNNEKDLKNEIEKMKLIKETHERKCFKIIKELEENLERVKNEFNLEHRLNNLSKEKSQITMQLSLNNTNTNSLPNIYQNIIIPSNENESEKTPIQPIKKKRYHIKNLKTANKEFEELQEQIKNKFIINKKQNIKNYINSRNERRKEMDNNNLFSVEEKNILKNIIPMECLNIYQNKYKTITDEKNQIIQILQKNKPRKKINEEKNQYMFLNDKKEHSIQKKNVEINSKILLITKNTKILNKEINELQKELDKINSFYKTKQNKNNNLKNMWISMNKDIKNKKIIIKKGETLTEDEINYINHFGKLQDIENFEKEEKNKTGILELNTT